MRFGHLENRNMKPNTCTRRFWNTVSWVVRELAVARRWNASEARKNYMCTRIARTTQRIQDKARILSDKPGNRGL